MITPKNNSTEKPIRWGFIGCGSVTEKTSGPAFRHVPNSTIRAIMRRDIDRARSSAGLLNAQRWYDSIDDLLNDEAVDAVYIATPPGLHLEHSLACCRARKPVYIEKPFARSFNEARAIVTAFEAAKLPLFVAHYRRALPRFLELKKIIDSGEIGEITDVRIRLTRRFEDDKQHSWLFEPTLSGGGKFFDIAPHAVDLLIFLFGEFAEVHSVVTTTQHARNLEDLVVFCFKTVGGVVGTANFNLVSDTKGDDFSIYGRTGSISTHVHGDKPIIVTNSNGGSRAVNLTNPQYIEEPMIAEIVKCLRGEDAVPCLGRDALETYRVIDLILAKFYGGREDDFWKRVR